MLFSDKNNGRHRPSTFTFFCLTENRRIFFGGSQTGRKSEKLSLMADFPGQENQLSRIFPDFRVVRRDIHDGRLISNFDSNDVITSIPSIRSVSS
jgi:hypothetical protein